jgi:uncharacterized phage protein (TIGR01671 family)
MREILFKAKSIATGEWVEGNLIQSPYMGDVRSWISTPKDKTRLRAIASYYGDWRAVEVNTNTICQYTVLTDKNDKKIWENDIIYNPAEERYFKVCWKKNGGIWVMHSIDDVNYIVDFECHYWSHDVEVVGNIFDNKELIGE